MSIIQILGYMRFFADWAPNITLLLEYLWESVTLSKLYDYLFGRLKTEYASANEQIDNISAQLAGIHNASLFKSFGIFSFIFVILVLLLSVYLLLRSIKNKSPTTLMMQEMLSKRLFYNSWIRYMFKSNIVFTHNNLVFVILLRNYGSNKSEVATTIANCIILVLVIVWPIFIVIFLTKNLDKLETPDYLKKYESMYQGVRTQHRSTLAYNAIWCARRFLLVVSFVSFSYFQYNKVYLIASFMAVLTIYIIYIYTTFPHKDWLFNLLELVNEHCIVMLIYFGLVSTIAPHYNAPNYP